MLSSKRKNLLYISLLGLIELVLFFLNYKPGTWLIGWDNLLPELNFSANFKRGLYSVWQEYRGLGLLDGMAHAASLVHTLFLFVLSLVVPKQLLRWLFTFLMHFLGGIGVFKLVKRFKHKDSELVAFLSSIFYLFNFATIQMFYAPLEVFSVHFIALPWLCLLLLKYLDKANKKNLFYLFLASFLFSTQGFVPTVFISFFILVISILFFNLVSKKNIKKVALALLAILISNSFWLLPFLYSGPASADTIKQAKINQISTRELILRNKEFADLKNVLLLRSFNLKFLDRSREGQMISMMDYWYFYIKRPEVVIISSLFVILLIVGIIEVVFKKRKKYYPFLIGLLLYFIFLGNNIIIFRPLWSFLEKFSPTLIEAFRIPFTKFSIGFVFCWTIILSLGLEKLIKFFKKKVVVALAFMVLIFWYAFPSFQGYFIYPKLKIKLPGEYLEIISFFKNQDINKRIAVLPQPSFWNWKIYNWGYRGSGFLWYGLPQPILDRAFDPWSKYNEDYYWQLSQAVYKEDLDLFNRVMDKYNIGYILFDSSVRSWHHPKELQLDTTLDLIEKSNNLKLIKATSSLRVYQVEPLKTNNYVYLTKNSFNIGPEYKFTHLDKAFLNLGDYKSSEDEEYIIYYPFRSLFTNRQSEEKEFKLEVLEKEVVFKNKITKDFENYIINLPNLLDKENFVFANLIINKEDSKIEFILEAVWPEVYINDKKIFEFKETKKLEELNITDQALPLKLILNGKYEIEYSGDQSVYPLALFKINNSLAVNSQTESFYYSDISFEDIEIPSLDIVADIKAGDGLKVVIPRVKGSFSYDSLHDLNFFKRQENIPFDISLLDLPQRFSYLINLKHKNLKGEPFFFYVINRTLIKREIETYLDKDGELNFILPQLKDDGLGYSLHFDYTPFAKQDTQNRLSYVFVQPIPFNFLKDIRIVNSEGGRDFYDFYSPDELRIYHPNPSYYKAEIKADKLQPLSYLVLAQAYDSGWLAWQDRPLIGKRLKDHVLINNWANGWQLDKDVKTIYLFFIPQLLEYLGFVLLGLSFIYGLIVYVSDKKAKHH